MKKSVILLTGFLLLGCAGQGTEKRNVNQGTSGGSGEMDRIARDYVKLVLALGLHDPDYVDAYYGPPEWKRETESAQLSLAGIEKRTNEILDRIDAVDPESAGEMTGLRNRFLRRHVRALAARAEILGGKVFSFDEESEALYDAVAPTHGEEHFKKIVARLEKHLPGPGSLSQRYEEYRRQFAIPSDRLDRVFQEAIRECRSRTQQRIDLPEGESFEVEYVTDKSWSGYNWYQGNYHSLIQVNTDLPIFIDRAIDLACHEGYPGHHVYNMLLEKNLVRDRGWVEFSVYPLFSPMSLIAEGSANFGIAIAFPGEEKIRFERETLFPLAGLDAAAAEKYYRIQELARNLNYAGNEAARRYLDGEIDAKGVAEWLEKYAMFSLPRARQRVRFIDQYRSYVINYNLGMDLVRGYVESKSGGGSTEERWKAFTRLLSSPHLPSDLQITEKVPH